MHDAPVFYVEVDDDDDGKSSVLEWESVWEALPPKEFFAVAKGDDGTAVVFLPPGELRDGELGYGGDRVIAVVVDCSEGSKGAKSLWW